MNRKGQFAGPVIGLITAGIVLVLMTVVFSVVFSNTGNAETGYSTGLTFAGVNITGTLSGFVPIIVGTVEIGNCTAGQTLNGVPGSDPQYTLNLGTGNLTLLNSSDITQEINTSCALDIEYRRDRGIDDTTSELINSTTYSAIDLVTVGLIILAAVLLLGLIFLLGRRA